MKRLEIKTLQKIYPNGVKAIDNISLEISNGMFGLLGPNGAGKSSLMKTIAGLQKPTSGTIHFNGVDIVKEPAFVKKSLGFLPQDFGVYPKVSAYNLLEHLAILKGVGNPRERKSQIINLLEKVNLLAVKNKEVYTFSGGMKQRFGVAQALLGNPQLIIVDEPTAGLDPEERNRFNMLLSSISEDVIVMLSTHLVEDVFNLCSKLAIIQQGTIRAIGKPSEMIASLKGKVWTKAIDHSELQAYRSNYKVISQHLVERVLHISVYANVQPSGFFPVTPTLELAYFQYLQ
ncbi:ABC-type multidrug transport system ATPase subunit [Lacibacter cauensis]|uniref:ABC-type multidrug transport system ATPase subunit n=1 Tax=Lacibacter cauensis TaxID=510947 RepID=A0A562SXW9_9BACT|nr:ABC transporter ATP-binding protein [Lacibacter cauensis]TWI85818.1 ABC-type multidrug transport system ATPase subunit [Lacibacter cauensis]